MAKPSFFSIRGLLEADMSPMTTAEGPSQAQRYQGSSSAMSDPQFSFPSRQFLPPETQADAILDVEYTPILSGLAWAIILGLATSAIFTLFDPNQVPLLAGAL